MNKFIAFFKQHRLTKHVAIIFLSTIILSWILLSYLDFYTLHDEFVMVPDYTGLSLEELPSFAEDKELLYEITDSIHDAKLKPGTVISQSPEAGAKVKADRTVYLTIVSLLPEQVAMPNLVDLSQRQAVAILQTVGLNVGPIQYVPDLAENAVLKQIYNHGLIAPGTKIKKGEYISLVVGGALVNKRIKIPYLLGLTYQEAQEKLKNMSLAIGSVMNDDISGDETATRIYQQSPAYTPDGVINVGETIDIFVKKENLFDYQALLNNMPNDSL